MDGRTNGRTRSGRDRVAIESRARASRRQRVRAAQRVNGDDARIHSFFRRGRLGRETRVVVGIFVFLGVYVGTLWESGAVGIWMGGWKMPQTQTRGGASRRVAARGDTNETPRKASIVTYADIRHHPPSFVPSADLVVWSSVRLRDVGSVSSSRHALSHEPPWSPPAVQPRDSRRVPPSCPASHRCAKKTLCALDDPRVCDPYSNKR